MKSMKLGVAVLTATLGLSACTDPPPPPTSPPQNPITLGAGGVYGNATPDNGGGPESAGARFASVSADGDVVAFLSSASNLAPGDTNGAADVFVRVRSSGAVERIAEFGLGDPRVSSNGRYVSYAAVNSMSVHDRVSGATHTWPITNGGTYAPVVPDDGSVAIYGWRDTLFGSPGGTCIVRDLATGGEQDCPHGDPGAGELAIKGVSANGRFVVYTWTGSSQGGVVDDFIWDRTLGTVEPAPLPANYVSFASVLVSDNGRFLGVTVFGNPIELDSSPVVIDRVTGTSQLVPAFGANEVGIASGMSRTGRYLAISTSVDSSPDDSNVDADIYRWDRITGDLTLASYDATTGTAPPTGGHTQYCGFGPGQVTDAGDVCVRSNAGLEAADTNGVSDAYLR